MGSEVKGRGKGTEEREGKRKHTQLCSNLTSSEIIFGGTRGVMWGVEWNPG